MRKTEFTVHHQPDADAATGQWSRELLDKLDIPHHFLTEIDYPGTVRGRVKSEIADFLGINEAPVIAVATHDTGSAVAAVPAQGGSYAFLSSGTWSLMGVVVDKPIINDYTLKWNYTNEGCVETIPAAQNIMGMWIFNECKREWIEEEKYTASETLIN